MKETLIKDVWVSGHGYTDILVRDSAIASIAPDLDGSGSTEIIDGCGALAWPGLVNTHHHLAQSLLKAIPAGINLGLDEWLSAIPYKAWPHYTPETLYLAACIGLLELQRGGCTLCADHHYLYHASTSPEMEAAIMQAAKDVGMRFVLCRGVSTNRGAHAGMRSTALVPETIDQSLQSLDSAVSQYHDTASDSMSRIAVAPVSMMHSCPPDDLRTLAQYAKENKLRRHSHLLEIARDEVTAQETHGMSALNYAESVGWLGDDVWFAHLVYVQENEIVRLAGSGTGISHCPVSNCRLGSGIAPAPALAAAGMTVSLGVDGSASAESGSLVNEMMMAWLIHRANGGSDATKVDQIADWGTRGGAEILGFPDAGTLQPGSLADLVLYDVDHPRFAGLERLDWAPVVLGEPMQARDVMVNGEWRIRDGKSLTIDEAELIANASAAKDKLLATI